MTNPLMNERPSCNEILAIKKLWALNDNEFEFEKELKNVVFKEKNRNFFIYSIIEALLKETQRMKKKSLFVNIFSSNYQK